MLRTIWKYGIEIRDAFDFEMPDGAEILSVQEQDGSLFFWALVDPDPERATVLRRFRMVGTGHLIGNERVSFLGTVQMRGGTLVLHVFEVFPCFKVVP